MSEILGIARFRIHEGKLEQFKRLSAQAMEIVKARDPGTLGYDTYFNADESECVIVERYRDSDGLIAHAANVADLFEPILSIVDVVHGEVLGDASPELRKNLAGSDVPALFTPYSSM